MKNHLVVRLLTGFVCVYCVILGLCLNGPDVMVRSLASGLLDYDMPEGSNLVFAARLIGVYMAFFGVTMGLVAWRPVQYRVLLTAGAGLLVLRALQRIFWFSELHTAFGTSAQKNWTYVITIVVLAALMLTFRLLLQPNTEESRSG